MAGTRMTVTVNTWVGVPCLFLAVRVSGYTQLLRCEGCPDRGRTVFVVSETSTARGPPSPVSVTVGARTPVVVTHEANAAP